MQAILAAGPAPRLAPPPIHGVRRLADRLVRFAQAAWGQPSSAMAAELAAVVVAVAAFTNPPAPGLQAAVVTPERAMVRTQDGHVYACRPEENTASLETVASEETSTGLLLSDADGIVSLDDRGRVLGHLATPLVERLLPGVRQGHWLGVGCNGHTLFEVSPENLQSRCVFTSPARLGDAVPGGPGYYVSLPESDTVAVVGRNQQARHALSVAGGPTVLAFDPTGHTLWVYCQQSQTIRAMDPSTGHGTAIPAPADDVVGMAQGDDRIFFIGQHSLASVAAEVPDDLKTSSTSAQDPVAWTFSAPTHSLVVAMRTPPCLQIWPAGGQAPPRTVPLPATPTALWLTP
ncbi:MAG TPA: hypothetical protein VGO93_06485 [Candidatus Xenobia bacterium]